MPSPGVVNNPAGVNSFDHFAPEPAYGEKIRLQRLAGASPLAGGQLAAGALNSARRAQRQAVANSNKPKPPKPPKEPPKGGIVGPVPEGVSPLGWPNAYPPGTIQNHTRSLWSDILAAPGAARFPILAYYAGAASR